MRGSGNQAQIQNVKSDTSGGGSVKFAAGSKSSQDTIKSYTTKSSSFLGDSSVSHKASSKTTRKSFFQSQSEAIRNVAMFANNIAMDDEEDMKSDHDGKALFEASEQEDFESGTEKLQRALTTETKQKSLFRHTDALGTGVGMEPDVLMRVALEDEWQMLSCASLPFTIVFFLIFMMFFQLHYRINDIYIAEDVLRDKLSKPATEITESFGIYSWLTNDYIPFLWTAKRDDAYIYDLNSSALHHELVAGIRFTITSAKKRKCEDSLVDYIECHSEIVDTNMPGAGVFSRRLHSSMPQNHKEDIEENIVQQPAEDDGQLLSPSTSLPDWARPGLSERWLHYERNRAKEFSPTVQPRRRTAEAFDWGASSSSNARRVDTHGSPAGDNRKRRRLTRLLPEVQSGVGSIPYRSNHGANHARSAPQALPKLSRERVEVSPKKPVADSHRVVAAERAGVKRRLVANRPEFREHTPGKDQGNISEIIIPMSWTMQEVLAEVQRWKANRVIEETMLHFRVEVLLLNQQLSKEFLTSLRLDLSLPRGGYVYTTAKMVTLVFSPVADDVIESCLFLMWVICLIAFSLLLPSRALMRWRQGRLQAHFFRFWNLMEWAIILWGWIVFILFILERLKIWSLKDDIIDYLNGRDNLPPWEQAVVDRRKLADFMDSAELVADLSSWCQSVVSVFHIILVCRFFLATRGQPRLAVVLSTIRKASVDLAHLFIVFLIIFLAYAIAGHILFGRRMLEFATFQGSFARCFQIVMERQYPWAVFTEEYKLTAQLWVWSFMILVVLVLVNIFLAMIFDTYGDVRSTVGPSATLWQTTKLLGTHLRNALAFGSQTSRWVPNRDIVQAVKTMQCAYVTPWMMKDALPGIANKQINYMFHLAKNKLETMLVRGRTNSLPAVMASILLGVDRMAQGLQLMDKNTERKGTTTVDKRKSSAMIPPARPPPWFKVQLIPHFQKQKHLLALIRMQIHTIESNLQQRGSNINIAPPPGFTPRSMRSPSSGSWTPAESLNQSPLSTPRGLSTPRMLVGVTASGEAPREEI